MLKKTHQQRLVNEHSGQVLDEQYQIMEPLGSTDLFLLYRAVNLVNKRLVVVKILKKQYKDEPNTVRRFLQESNIMASLKHRNLVEFYNNGSTEAGEPYLVMEFIDGRNLEVLAKECGGYIPLVRCLRIFVQATAAMMYAHSMGYLHRDLSPGNIMVLDSVRGEDFVKIVDFGVVKVLDFADQEAFIKTMPGETLGTPMYMSPEQIKGSNVDGRADIYSLGAVLYQAITGSTHFPSHVGPFEVMKMQISTIPRSPQESRPDLKIPDAVNNLVMRALAKDPANRYQTMAGFHGALRGLLEDIAPRSYGGGRFGQRVTGWLKKLTGQ